MELDQRTRGQQTFWAHFKKPAQKVRSIRRMRNEATMTFQLLALAKGKPKPQHGRGNMFGVLPR